MVSHLNTTICIGSMIAQWAVASKKIDLNTTICIGSIKQSYPLVSLHGNLNTTICIGSMSFYKGYPTKNNPI